MKNVEWFQMGIVSCLCRLSDVNWCFFLSYRLKDRETNISNLKESMYQWCNKYCQGQLFWSWFFISQILISFKKCLKGSKAMSNISSLANFKNWSDFKISLITLFVNLSTCCTNSWNLSFSLQVHALITFITGWTKLES